MNRPTGFSIVELVLTGFILLLLLAAISLITGAENSSLQKGTRFTINGDWVRSPAIIGSNAHGKLVYGMTSHGTGVDGVRIRFTIRSAGHVIIMSKLENEETIVDRSTPANVETTQGDLFTNTSGEAVLELAALTRGTIEVSALVIDPAGNIHEDPVVQLISVDNSLEVTTHYP